MSSSLFVFGKPVDIVNNSLLSLGTQDAPQDYARLVPEDQRSESQLNNPESTLNQFQPWQEKVARAGNNFMVNTFGMGALMFGANDPQELIGAVTGQEREYGNDLTRWASKYMQDNQQPVYEAKPDDVNPSDSAWWLNRASELGSLAGIALESAAEAALITTATGGLGSLGEGLNIARKTEALLKGGSLMSKMNRERLFITGSYGLSGVKEALLESNDVFDTTYNSIISQGGSEEIAKKYAANAASSVFTNNAIYKMVTNTLMARAMTYSPIRGWQSTNGIVDKTLERLPNKFIRGTALAGAGAFEEGLEEGLQYIFQEEGKYNAENLAGFAPDKTMSERYGAYIRNADFLNSVIVGAAGGTALPLLSKGLEVATGRNKNPYQSFHDEVSKKGTGINMENVNEIGMAIANDDIISANVKRRDMSNREALSKLHLDVLAEKEGEGLFNDHVDFLVNTLKAAEDGNEAELSKFGATDELSVENIKKTFPKLIEDAKTIERIYKEEAEINNRKFDILPPIVQRRFESEIIGKELTKVQSELTKIPNPYLDKLSPTGNIRKGILDNINNWNLRKAILEERAEHISKDDSFNNKILIDAANKNVESLASQLEKIAYSEEDISNGVKDKDEITLEAIRTSAKYDKLNVANEYLKAKQDALTYEIANWRDVNYQEKKKKEIIERVKKETTKKKVVTPTKKVENESNSELPVYDSQTQTTDVNTNNELEELPVDTIGNARTADSNNKTEDDFNDAITKAIAESKGKDYIVFDPNEQMLLSPKVLDTEDKEVKAKALKAVSRFMMDNGIFSENDFENVLSKMVDTYGKDKVKSFYYALALGWNEFGKEYSNRPISKYSKSNYTEMYNSYFGEEDSPDKILQEIEDLIDGNEPKEKVTVRDNDEVKHVNIDGFSQTSSNPTTARVINFSTDNATFNAETNTIEHRWEATNKMSETNEIDILALDNYEEYKVGKELTIKIPDNFMDVRIGWIWSDEDVKKYNLDPSFSGKKMNTISMEVDGKWININPENPLTFGHIVNGIKIKVVSSSIGDTKEIFLKVDKGTKEYNNNIPMKIYDGDKSISFVHTTDWHHPARTPDVDSKIINAIKEETSNIRESVINNGSTKIKITNTTFGQFGIAPKIKPTLLSKVSPNSNASIVGIKTSKAGEIITANGEKPLILNPEIFSKLDVNGKEFIVNGMSLILYPAGRDENGRMGYIVGRGHVVTNEGINVRYVKDLFINDNDGDKIISSVIGVLKKYTSKSDEVISGKKMNNKIHVKEYIKQFVSLKDVDKVDTKKPNSFYFNGQFVINDSKGNTFSINEKTPLNDKTLAWLDYLEKVILPESYVERNIKAITENLPVSFINKDGGIERAYNSYGEYLRSKIITSTPEFNVGTENNPVWTALLQRTISYSEAETNVKQDQVDQSTKEKIIVSKESDVKIEKEKTEVAPTEKIEGLNDDEISFVKDAIVAIANMFSSDIKNVFSINDLNIRQSPAVRNDLIDMLNESIHAISGLLPSEQADFIDSIYNTVVGGLEYSDQLSGLEVTETIENNIKDAAEYIKEEYGKILSKLEELVLKNSNLQPLVNDYQTLINKADTILNNYDILTLQVKDKLYNASLIKEVDDEEDVAFDKSAEEISAKQKASFNIRRFVGATYDLDEDGNIKKGFFGLDKFINSDEIYDRLTSVLSDVGSNFDTMIEVMKEWGNVYPWLYSNKNYDVVNRILNSNNRTKNEFVTLMAKHKLGMKTPMFSTQKKNYTFTMTDTNSNTNKRAIVKDWLNNIRHTVTTFDEESGYYIFNKELIVPIYDEMKKWSDDINYFNSLSIEDIKSNFDKIGINLSLELLSEWKRNGIRDSSYKARIPLNNMINDSNYIFWYTRNELKKIIDSNEPVSFIIGKGLKTNISFANTVVYNTAAEEAKYTKARVVTSWRDGKKSIYGYTQNTFATHRTVDLKNGLLYNELNQSYFNTNSLLLSLLNTDTSFKSKFNVSVIAKNALKQLGVKLYKDASITNLGDSDHELAKLIGFMDSKLGTVSGVVKLKEDLNISRRMGAMFGLTMSDKSSMYIFDNAVFDFNQTHFNNGTPIDEVLNLIYSHVIEPEINRVIAHHNSNDKNLKNIAGYNPSYIYQIPVINIIDVNGKKLIDIIRDGEFNKEEHLPLIINELRTFINETKDKKVASWKQLGIANESSFVADGAYKEKWGDVNNDELLNYTAYDYTINYILHNSDMYKLYGNDPAVFYKNSSVDKNKPLNEYTNDDIFNVINDTLINTGKRLAMLNAPGTTLSNSENNKYIQIFMEDNEVKGGKFYEYLLKNKGKVYADNFYEVNETDAQEYMTWNEFVYIIDKAGRLEDILEGITLEEFNSVKDLVASGKKELTNREEALLKKVIQPIIKPVYTGQHFDEQNKLMRSVYVKSSAFVLVPQLTEGLEIDKLRLAMEEIESNSGMTVRASYASANKVGSIKNAVNIFSNDGTINTDELVKNPDAYTMQMDRRNFRLQQDIPLKSAKKKFNEISMGTQMVKLMFSDGAINFDYDGVSGSELYNQYSNLFNDLIQFRKNNLFDYLMVDEFGNYSPENKLEAIQKFRDLLKEEAENRGYSRQDKDSLDIDDNGNFRNPIWLLPNADKIEALLHSIVSKKIAKVKMPGYSYVAGSEAGFRLQSDFTKVDKSEIVWTNEPIDGLNHNDVLIPCRYKLSDGKDIDLIRDGFAKKITLKGGKTFWQLDKDKMSEELLQIISFRIPTSKHASMSLDNIVGFLPATAGDIMILANSKTKQKGLDFDVDKENTYHYAVEIDENGKLIKLSEKEDQTNEEKERIILNKIIEMQKKVLSNPNVQNKMLEIISTDDAEQNANGIYSLIGALDRNFSPLTDSYQKEKLLAGASGKLSIGAYSLDVVLQAQLEQLFAASKSLQLNEPIELENGKTKFVPLEISIGKYTSTGILGNINTLDGARTIAEVLSERQNISTDNEKLQVLGKVNLNAYTLTVDKILTLLGFDKGDPVTLPNGKIVDNISFLLMSQPIIKDYVKEISNLDSSIGEFVSRDDKDRKVTEILEAKYGNNELETTNLTNENLVSQLNGNIDNELQRTVLSLFLKLKDYGTKIQDVQTSVNIDSKGLGISFFDTLFDIDNLVKIGSGDPFIKNKEAIIGNFEENPKDKTGYIHLKGDMYVKPNTIPGIFTINTLTTAYRLWNKHFPYETSIIYKSLADIYKEVNVDKARTLVAGLKKFIYSDVENGLNFSDAQSERIRLAIDEVGSNNEVIKESLPTYIKRIISNQNIDFIIRNTFLNSLDFNIETNNTYSTMTFNNTMEDAYTEEDYYASIINLLTNENIELPTFNGESYNPRKLGEDIIKYAFLEGGIQEATQFVKYIPLVYLNYIGFNTNMKDYTYRMNNELVTEEERNQFLVQYFRHNPKIGTKIRKNDFSSLAKEGNLNTQYVIFDRKLVKDKFISIYDTSIAGGYHMYVKIDEKKNLYRKVTTLGQNGMSEYDRSFTNYPSNIKKNNQQLIKNDILKVEVKPIQKVNTEIPSQLKLQSVIESIALDTSMPGYSKLASEFLKSEYIKKVINNVTFEVTNLESEGLHAFRHIQVSNNLTGNDFSRVVLHELIHELTFDKLYKYVSFNGNDITEVLDNAPTYIKELVDIFEQVRKTLRVEVEDMFNMMNEKNALTTESRMVYGAYDLFEFVSEIMTNPDFQLKLNDIKYNNSNNTLLDKFYNFVINILGSMGIKVKSDSTLIPAIINSMKLINENGKVEEINVLPFDSIEGLDIPNVGDNNDWINDLRDNKPSPQITDGNSFSENISENDILNDFKDDDNKKIC